MKTVKKSLQRLWCDGFFSIVASGTLSKMVAFLSSIVVVRLVSKSSYGHLAYADNIINYVTLFAGFGMHSAVLKYCGGDDELSNRTYFHFALRWGSIFQALLVAFVALAVTGVQVPFEESRILIYLLLPYGFLYYWANLLLSMLRVQSDNRGYARASMIQVIVSASFSILLALTIGVRGIPIARTCAMVIPTLVFLPRLAPYARGDFRKLGMGESRLFLEMSASLLINSVLSLMMPLNEGFLVNNLIADEMVSANYKVANLIPSQLPFVASTIVIYFFPKVARMKADSSAWSYVRRIGIWTLVAVSLVAFVGFALNPLIIRVAYGDAYADSNSMSKVLWLVYLVNAGLRIIPMNMLAALGYARHNAVIAIVTAVVHIALSYALLLSFGVWGAISGRAIANIMSALAYWFVLRAACVGHLPLSDE